MNAPENRFLHAAVNIKKPLRITVVTETYPPDINGVAHTLSKIVQALTSNGHTVCLVRPRHALHHAAVRGPGASATWHLASGPLGAAFRFDSRARQGT